MLKRILAGVVLSLMLTGGAVADPFEEAMKEATDALERGDGSTYVRLLLPLAEAGDARAQLFVGIHYHSSPVFVGVHYHSSPGQDYAEAMKWYRRAADQDAAKAVCGVGGCTIRPQAQFKIGDMYAKGQGVRRNYAEAVKWYRLSAEQGYAEAQMYLGLNYLMGEGVPQDYVLAHMWSNLAASRFMDYVIVDRDWAVKNRGIAASEMTPAQIAEAQRLAREWKPK